MQMQNINIPIYLVSLEQDTKRREELKKRFKNFYNKFIHIKATDGRKLSAKEYYDQTIDYFIKRNKIMSPSELGCTLSHINALEEFMKTDSYYALILEDDVIGNDKDIEKIFEISQKLDQNSLFICGGQDGLSSKKYQFGKETSLADGLFEVCKFSYQHIFRTCCYVVTKKSAKEILEYHKKCLTLADEWDEFFKNSDTKIYYANILSHPKDLVNSHIEEYRAKFKTKSFIEKIFSKNFFGRVWKKLYNELYSKLLKIKGKNNL